MADKKYDVSPSKKAVEEAQDDPYFKKLKEKRAERLKKIKDKLADDPIPKEKEPEKESREDYLKRTNKRYINMLRDKRIMQGKNRMKKSE